ncbi:MAG: TauD/TfdA family dioxygenase [Parachlamydiaceae bacterium]|nr:TauD/TfdA family dioxygenase [Parachlamydiaceae bacterium]
MKGLKESWLNSEKMPLVIEPTESMSFKEALKLISSQKEILANKLLGPGALLFRNFPISDASDFSEFIKTIDEGKFLDYIGGDSPRNKVKDGVYTSTEAPPSIKIPLHNELSFVKNYPKKIYFYCHIAPQEKGETTIADARKIYSAMDEHVKMKFNDKGLQYISNYFYKSSIMDFLNKVQRSHKSWVDVFETNQKDSVETKCLENDFEFAWGKKDWLRVCQKRPSVMAHPITKDTVWFNQAHLYDFNPKLLGWWRYLGVKLFYFQKYTRLHEIAFGDGSPIPRKDLYHILDVLESHTIYFPWQKGDILMLDNVLAMHGRATFTGKRRIFAAMTG